MRLGVQLLLTALVALTTGCTSLPIAATLDLRTAHDYFPLHPGTFWVYEVRDAAGRVAIERVLVRGPYHLKTHAADATIVEESGGMTGEFDLDVSWHPVVYYRRGLFLYKFSGVNLEDDEQLREVSLGEGEEKVLPDDPVEQREWQSDFEIFGNGGDEYSARMVSIAQPSREAVHVRAGTFRGCLRVDSESWLAAEESRSASRRVAYRYTDWYAPGVGLVKTEVRVIEHAAPVTTFELLSFRDGRRGH